MTATGTVTATSRRSVTAVGSRSADSAQAFGITPRVAMISYSTGTSGAGEEVEKVKRATNLVRERRPEAEWDGLDHREPDDLVGRRRLVHDAQQRIR